jgi:filamentous hemagglutinin family protein
MNRPYASTCNEKSRPTARFALKPLAISVMLAFASNVHALPTGGAVSAGAATISGGASSTTITQSTQNVAINWQSFGIAQGEAVRFVQPNASAVALNRVLGADPSSILGSLSANGKVFLVNPNGILFGKGAQVNVGGLVASTLNVSDADFMAGTYRFSGAGNGAIVNQGTLNADGGYVALLGANVSNEGVISANLGTVALAAGAAVTLDVAGDGLLNVTVNQGALNAVVQNGGLIRANGGQVLMTAQAAGSLLNTVVNNTGIIEAQTLENRNGTIRLLGDMQSGTVNVGGTLDASGSGAGQIGGSVRVLGHTVNLASAAINVSGDAGGGLALVGGNFHGAGPEQNSQRASFDARSIVNADAIRSGDGGRIAVWSDGITSVAGTLTARGGASSGDGGFIETSGHRVILADSLRVNTLAPRGKTGLWLLDPFPDFVIATVGGDETPAAVELSLAISNRLITATRDVIVSDALVWSTAQTLELRAGNDVRIDAAVTASTAGSGFIMTAVNDVVVTADVTASGAGSRITMNAQRDVVTTGAITASALGAAIDMQGGRNVSVGVVTADGGGSVNLRGANNVVVNGTISADGGPVTLIADNDGTGPGVIGGTVSFVGVGQVVSPNTTIRFNPAAYAATTAEIANYVTKVSAANDIRAWVFARADNKTYDGTTAATLSFRGDPTSGGDVTLVPGTATFDTPAVGTTKTVTYNGFTTGGVDVARFELFSAAVPGSGTTTADVTQAPLTITANNATKVYGETAVLATSAFTSLGLVNAETIGSVTLTSPGTVATATVAGNPHLITPSDPVAGTFTASNYAINFVDGTLIVTPAPLIVTASNASKVFGQTTTISAFTQAGLVNGETIGAVTGTSPGTAAGATVAGSTYPITLTDATGGTFTASNYTIAFVGGALTVTPAVAAPPVVVPPGSTPPGSTPPDATPPDQPTGTIPGPTSVGATDPSTTDPSTTDPSTTDPSVTAVGASDTAYPTSSIAYPVSSVERAVAGLNLSVVGGGVNMPPVQMAATAPGDAARMQSESAGSTFDAAPVTSGALAQAAPLARAPVAAPAARPKIYAPVPRRPKQDRH